MKNTSMSLQNATSIRHQNIHAAANSMTSKFPNSISCKVLNNAIKSCEPSNPHDIHHCKICNITLDSSIKIYNWNNSVHLCQSCRKIYYNVWREILTDNYVELIKYKISIDKISEIVFNYLNQELHSFTCRKEYK